MLLIYLGISGQADHDSALGTFFFFLNPVLKAKLKIQVQHLGGNETVFPVTDGGLRLCVEQCSHMCRPCLCEHTHESWGGKQFSPWARADPWAGGFYALISVLAVAAAALAFPLGVHDICSCQEAQGLSGLG